MKSAERGRNVLLEVLNDGNVQVTVTGLDPDDLPRYLKKYPGKVLRVSYEEERQLELDL